MLFAKFVPGFASVATAMAGAVRPALLEVPAVRHARRGALGWRRGRAGLAVPRRDQPTILDTLAALGQYGLGLVAIVLVAYVASKWLRRQLFVAQLRMDRVSVDELLRCCSENLPTTILDVRYRADAGGERPHPRRAAVDMDRIADGVAGVPSTARSSSTARVRTRPARSRSPRSCARCGFKRVRPLHGGIDAWIAAGLGVETRCVAPCPATRSAEIAASAARLHGERPGASGVQDTAVSRFFPCPGSPMMSATRHR